MSDSSPDPVGDPVRDPVHGQAGGLLGTLRAGVEAGLLCALGFGLADGIVAWWDGPALTVTQGLGCLAASEVISHFGARPVADLKELARGEGIAV